MTQKNTLYKSLLATKTLESAVDMDMYTIIQRYGYDDHEIMALVNHVHSIVEVTMGSLRAKLIKLENDINTLTEKRAQAEKT